MIHKVLIANRGEIAVRIARACRDAGLTSVAVYAEPDRDALHVTTADEAFALGGATAAQSYLRGDALIAVALRCGADAVHPGYGFLAEDAAFARAVRRAGLTWIGPPPEAIEALGDKVSARRTAEAVGAPLAPGTPGPVTSAAEVLAFVDAHGLPIAIKAAFGGGGRGLRVARHREEVAECFEAAVREATAAFGRGECFVERYLDRPRHVETQCLADAHGTVVVLSTRDCTLQRRHQKLVEEAPAPFLTDAQDAQLRAASIAILRAAGYVGAGTCEFLLGADGTLSFLEVNTRLQVEHPVTEEVTGIDVVAEQLRIAAGEPLGYSSVTVRGHSIEFRINGEDPANGFLPVPGTLATFSPPSGPGVRVDSGVRAGDVVSGAFDSLLAKLVVTGATREQALGRARRALAEFEVTGVPTVLPFHRRVVRDPAFAPGDGAAPSVHTRWIETEWAGAGPLADGGPGGTGVADGAGPGAADGAASGGAGGRETVVVEVGGRRLEVVLPAGLGGRSPVVARRQPRRARAASATSSGEAGITAPMQGTIIKVAVTDGQHVREGDVVVVLEAMKMEQPLLAHRAGVVAGLDVVVGQTLSTGALICEVRGG